MLEKLEGGIKGIKIPFYRLWRQVFLDYFNRYDSGTGIILEDNAYYDVQNLFSGRENVTVLYTIDELPERLPVRYGETIRLSIAGSIYTRVSFATLMQPYATPWNSSKVKNRMHTWAEADENRGDDNAYTVRDNKESALRSERRRASMYYLSDAEQVRHRRSFKFQTLMLVNGVRGEDFDTSLLKIEKTCKYLGLTINRVTENLDKYVSVISPARLAKDGATTKGIGSTVLTDEILARLSNYTQGKVGVGPVYWGTDVYSDYPVWSTIKEKSTDAENILIVAETGGGKSYFVKTLLTGLLSDSRFTSTIADIEGFEYTPLIDLIGKSDSCVQLNMAEGHGAYFDPVEIYQTGDEILDADMYSTSKNYTIAILKTLMGDYAKGNLWVDTIINDAVSKTYSDAGVTDDPGTWGYSHGLTLRDVYNNVIRLYSQDSSHRPSLDISAKVAQGNNLTADEVVEFYKDNAGYCDAKDQIVAQLSRYFAPGGTRSNVFREPVGIDKIRDARVVICSFGLAGKTEKTIDPIQLALTQLYAADIMGLRSIFMQAKGKYCIKLWEEFQRWGSLPDSDKTISTALTGGRKLGDVNIIITNKVSELLQTDRFGIFESTTSFAIGAINDSKIRHELAERLNIERLIPDLDRLAKDSESKDMNALYRYAFVVHPKKGEETVTNMQLPADIADSPLFRTGVKVSGGEGGDGALAELRALLG